MISSLLIITILQILLVGQSSGLVPQITRLNVQCDRSGMKVNVEFDNAFNGIIFSKGHFSDPNCRHVQASGARNAYEFFISSQGCGTALSELPAQGSLPQGFKNVIIIQNDPEYQEFGILQEN
ncbi:hypothetical protein SSS_05239 [Sarcoptes scabiei]|nr:hypothetical protein SSS_05239 [Sarcoptes scabiei]